MPSITAVGIVAGPTHDQFGILRHYIKRVGDHEGLKVELEGRGDERFYKKHYDAPMHDIMLRVGDCGHNSWENAHSADKARKGIARLEGGRNDWKTVQHCASCTGGGMWRVRW